MGSRNTSGQRSQSSIDTSWVHGLQPGDLLASLDSYLLPTNFEDRVIGETPSGKPSSLARVTHPNLVSDLLKEKTVAVGPGDSIMLLDIIIDRGRVGFTGFVHGHSFHSSALIENFVKAFRLTSSYAERED